MTAPGSGAMAPAVLASLLALAACSGKESESAAEADSAAAGESGQPATEAVAAAPASGATTYQTFCVTCHGASGKGDGVAAAGLDPKPADFSAGAFRYDTNGNGVKGEVADIQAIVRDGAAKHGGSPLMAPWPMLTPEQLQAVAEHVKSLHAD